MTTNVISLDRGVTPSVLAAVRAERDRRDRLAALADECERDLHAFVRHFWHVIEPAKPFVDGWVIQAMCDLLMAVTDSHHTRLIINVPPGFSKSTLLNVLWPAWEWGPCGMPHLRYISASYTASNTERDNRRFAAVVRDPVYQRLWGHHVRLIADGQERVENSRTGWKIATSTGGSVTGKRGDRFLIDDANNPNDVESESVRTQANHWLREVVPDRLNDLERSVIVNLQQRVHEQDATGTLAEHGTGYTWLCVPMRFDPLRSTPVVLRTDDDGQPTEIWRDPRGLDERGIELPGIYTDPRGERRLRMGSPMAQAEGALAWPERFSEQSCVEQERIKGPFAWAGQYQQSPTVRGGGTIRRDWWRIWTQAAYPPLGTVVVSVDTAIEQREEADYNALTAWGAFAGPSGEPQLILLDAWRMRGTLAQVVARIRDTCTKRKADYLLIEHKTRGRDVSDEILRLYTNAPWSVELVKPKGDKVSRLQAVAHLFSGDVRYLPQPDGTRAETFVNGMIWAPDKEWAEEVISEVAAFPRAAHDDYTDTVAQAVGWIRRNGVVLRKTEWEAEELERQTYKRPVGVPYAL